MSYYEILSVSSKADIQTILAAYNTKLFECHYLRYDKIKLDQIRLLYEAIAVLSDPVRRKIYDRSLDSYSLQNQKPGLDFVEQRRIPRVTVDLNASYKIGDQTAGKAKIFDISSQGCGLRSKESIREGSIIALEIAGHFIKGTIKWKRLIPCERIYELGVQFEKCFDLTALVDDNLRKPLFVSQNIDGDDPADSRDNPVDDSARSVTWDAITNERIWNLDANVQGPAIDFINAAKAEGINLRVTSGVRTIEEQNILYAQGRTTPGEIVTNAKGGKSQHNFGRAIDIVQIVDGKANWEADWEKIGQLGEKFGFEWGGRWQAPDRPHFQMRLLPK